MAKEIEGKLKLQVPAGQANPSPPVGPALGQRGINIMDFCKVFNEKSKGEQPGVMLPVVVTYNTDKSFSIEIKLPPASFFIKEALKINKQNRISNAIIMHEWEKCFFHCHDVTRFDERFIDVVV